MVSEHEQEVPAAARNRPDDHPSRSLAANIQRKRMLGAALKRFSSTGYLGTKISDIASEAGVSHGLIHHYFGSKEHLYYTILEAGLAYLQETRERALRANVSADYRIRKWVYSTIHCFDQHDTYLFGRLVMQVLGAPDMHPPACVDALNRFTSSEVGALAAAVAEGGKPEEEALKLACLAFNTLLGNKLIGMMDNDSLNVLYETGCRLLGVSGEPLPETAEYPVFPWSVDGEAEASCKL